MSISWAEGLLAGAAGVAEYSEQERIRRQKRMDRTTELQNQMKMHQAKSLYAVKLNEYSENRKQLKALSSVESGSFQEQLILHKSLGLDDKTANIAAQEAWRSKKLLKRPDEMKMPEYIMPAMMEGRASSPAQDWARAYFGSDVIPEEQVREVLTQEAQAEQQALEEQLAPPAPAELTASLDGPVAQTERDRVSRGDIDKAGDRFFETLFAKPAEYEKVTTETIRDGKKFQTVTLIDMNNPDGRPKQVHIPKGETAIQRLDPVKVTNEDGSVDMFQQGYDPVTGKATVYSDTKFRVSGPEPTDPVEMVSTTELSDYMRKGTDDRPPGEFYADFPETEREMWKEFDKGEGLFNLAGTEEPEGFGMAVGSVFKQFKKNAFDSGRVTNRHFSGDPDNMSKLTQLWKAQAYVQVLGVDGVADAVKMGAIDPEVFNGPISRRLKASQAIRNMLKEEGKPLPDVASISFNF